MRRSNIVLIGMRGSGKSTIGKILAEKLKMDFLDSDEEIEKREKMSITEIVGKNGWEHFRKLEQNEIARISKLKSVVISTGGGVILNSENVKALKKNGILIFLNAPVETLEKRISQNKNLPLLPNSQNGSLKKVWEERRSLYESVKDFEIDALPAPYDVADNILVLYHSMVF